MVKPVRFQKVISKSIASQLRGKFQHFSYKQGTRKCEFDLENKRNLQVEISGWWDPRQDGGLNFVCSILCGQIIKRDITGMSTLFVCEALH